MMGVHIGLSSLRCLGRMQGTTVLANLGVTYGPSILNRKKSMSCQDWASLMERRSSGSGVLMPSLRASGDGQMAPIGRTRTGGVVNQITGEKADRTA